MKLKRVVAMDVGNSNSSIARYNGRAPEVISVDGEPLLPSVVTIVPADAVGPDEHQIFVGLDGVEAGKRYRSYCFRNFKRKLGERWHDEEDTGHQTVQGADGDTHYQGPDGHTYSPVELFTAVISKLLDAAKQKFRGEEPDGAVICVPATFTPSQRKAVEEAGRAAGLSYIELMDEPTAAAVAYGYDFKKVRRIAVLDVGGSTTDVSIIQTGNGLVTVLGTGGSSITGGHDFDTIVGRWVINEWGKAHDGVDLAVDDTAMALIHEEAEETKKRLSRKMQTEFRIKDFDRTPGGTDEHMIYPMDREFLETISKELLARMRKACEVAIADAKRKDANFSVKDLHAVVLVGGGTRMPAVQRLAEDVFGQAPKSDIDQEVAVVLGAAMKAAVLEGRISDLTISDILSYTVSVEVYDKVEGVASVVLPRGTSYPTDKPLVFPMTNREPGQATLPVRIIAGDSDRAAGCDLLHSIDLGIPAGDPRSARVSLVIGLNSRGEVFGACGDVKFGEAA